MPQRDAYHETVRKALIKDGWSITHDPLVIKLHDLRCFVDLGAEKVIAAAEREERIAVEIKVFGSPSKLDHFERAVGQYTIYRWLLEDTHYGGELYLAIATDIYEEFFQRETIQMFVQHQRIKLLVFDAEKEEVVQWIN